jgi:Bacterial alpha-L-rhamnosidase C-terminal domain
MKKPSMRILLPTFTLTVITSIPAQLARSSSYRCGLNTVTLIWRTRSRHRLPIQAGATGLTQGATTSRETWSHTSAGQSEDHAFLGTFEDWLYQYLGGIKAAAPGYAKVRIKPFMPTGLDCLSARITTPHGEVSSTWWRVQDGLRLEVEIPDGTPAEIFVPVSTAGVHAAASPAKFVRDENGYRVYELGPQHDRQIVFDR